MVELWGLAAAAKALAAMAAIAWVSAAFSFSRQFVAGGAAWALVIFAALLPASYGAPYPFGFAELIAIPRPFAEAFVLASLSALASGRDKLSLYCLMASGLLHPLMALPGLGVGLIVLGTANRRWFLYGGVGLILIIIAGALGLPLLDRLFTAVDPSLRSLYEQRSPFLFPSHWPVESFPQLIVQAVTIAIAAHLQHGRRRRIFAAIGVVGLGGIAVAAVCGDWLSSLLVVQLQPWRTAWLMSAAGGMALGLCALALWPRGASGRMTLAFLTLGWSFCTQCWVAAPAAILAGYTYFLPGRFEPLLRPPYVHGVSAFTVAAALIWHLQLFAYPWQFALAAPAGYADPAVVLLKELLPLPLCALAGYLAIARPQAPAQLQAGFAVALFAAAVSSWDHRSLGQRMLEDSRPPPEMMYRIDQRKGEVFWVSGSAEAWYMLGRPQWATSLQGIPTIFSPALASEWRSRMEFLMGLRLADQKSFARWSAPSDADAPRVSRQGLVQLCARKDAPAWTVVPLETGSRPPAGLEMTVWRLPEPVFKLAKGDGGYAWQRIDAYGLIACAAQAQTQPGR